ncbi:hypothetical protein [Croceicoccus sp. Ery5]|uniref:hypothetical protein n=1 Tax=Croceicoccus sp. Ery5 TaxID=1703340 RepID=UPI001E35CE74|nr:hypothetical protein [Croceicoccus sp. Ery5]
MERETMAQRGSDRAAGKEPAPAPSATAPSVTAKCWHGGSYLGAPPVNARADLAQGGWGAKSKEDAVLRCRFSV